MTSPADAEHGIAEGYLAACEAENRRLRQQNAALLMVALRARDVWGSWGRVDSKLEALGHALAVPVAQELVAAALAQTEQEGALHSP